MRGKVFVLFCIVRGDTAGPSKMVASVASRPLASDNFWARWGLNSPPKNITKPCEHGSAGLTFNQQHGCTSGLVCKYLHAMSILAS
jgi:hypothetical protein